MKKIYMVSFVALSFFISSCVSSGGGKAAVKDTGSSGAIPLWVTSPPDVPGYLYGVGMASAYAGAADALQRARENARVELIKQLNVKVTGQTTASVQRKIAGGKSKITRALFNYAESSIEETELPGIKIVKSYFSKKDKEAYALSELNRSFAEMDLSEKLEQLDAKIASFAKRNPVASKLKAIKMLMPALKLISERQKIVKNILLITKLSDEKIDTADSRYIEQRLAFLLDSITIVLVGDENQSDEIASGIRKSFADQGVKVRSNGNGDLYMTFSASLNSVYRDDVYYVFATGYASVKDKDNNVVSEISTKVKGGSGDKALAKKRAIEKLAQKLGDSIATGLFKLK